jgi:hypothetical protein
MPKITNIVNRRFARLVVLRFVRMDTVTRRALWQCRCDCGNLILTDGVSLRNGNTKSCGCLQREKARKRCLQINQTHGFAARAHRSPIYDAWLSMIQRCTNPNCSQWKRYGGRGIKVCKQWQESFETFINDMGLRPHGMSLGHRQSASPKSKTSHSRAHREPSSFILAAPQPNYGQMPSDEKT